MPRRSRPRSRPSDKADGRPSAPAGAIQPVSHQASLSITAVGMGAGRGEQRCKRRTSSCSRPVPVRAYECPGPRTATRSPARRRPRYPCARRRRSRALRRSHRLTTNALRHFDGGGIDRGIGLARHHSPRRPSRVEFGQRAGAIDEIIAALDHEVGVGAQHWKFAPSAFAQQRRCNRPASPGRR